MAGDPVIRGMDGSAVGDDGNEKRLSAARPELPERAGAAGGG